MRKIFILTIILLTILLSGCSDTFITEVIDYDGKTLILDCENNDYINEWTLDDDDFTLEMLDKVIEMKLKKGDFLKITVKNMDKISEVEKIDID